MRQLTFLIFILWSGALCAQESGVTTPDNRQQAEMLYQSAVELFGEGRYKESLKSFDDAIALDPESVFFCNRAVVHIELGDANKGLSDLKKCRSSFEGDESELAQIDAQTAAVNIGVNHLIQNAKGTTRGIQRAILDNNTTEKFGVRGWGVVTLAVGGGAIASAIVIDLLSADLVAQFVEEGEGRSGTNVQDFADLKQQVKTRQTIFYALAITGGVLSATGVAMILFGGSEKDTQTAKTRFIVGPNQVGVYGEF